MQPAVAWGRSTAWLSRRISRRSWLPARTAGFMRGTSPAASVALWHMPTGRPLAAPRHLSATAATSPSSAPASAPADSRRLGSVAISADDKLVAACGVDGIHLWQLADGKYLGKVAAVSPEKVSFSRDGKSVKAVVGDCPTTWKISDKSVVSRDKVRRLATSMRPTPPDSKLRHMDDADDALGEYSAGLWAMEDQKGSCGLIACVCDAQTGPGCLTRCFTEGKAGSRGTIALSPDSRFMAVSVWNSDGRLTNWDTGPGGSQVAYCGQPAGYGYQFLA